MYCKESEKVRFFEKGLNAQRFSVVLNPIMTLNVRAANLCTVRNLENVRVFSKGAPAGKVFGYSATDYDSSFPV